MRKRNITGREITVLTLASVAMAALLIVGVIVSQHPAPTTSAKTSSMEANTSANTALGMAVSPHQTYNAMASATLQGNTVTLSLTVKEVLVSIAPAVAYHAWTFNGTVP